MDPYLEVALTGKCVNTQRVYRTTISKCLEVTKCESVYALLVGGLTTYNKLAEVWPKNKTLKKALQMLCVVMKSNPTIVSSFLSDWWLARLVACHEGLDLR